MNPSNQFKIFNSPKKFGKMSHTIIGIKSTLFTFFPPVRHFTHHRLNCRSPPQLHSLCVMLRFVDWCLRAVHVPMVRRQVWSVGLEQYCVQFFNWAIKLKKKPDWLLLETPFSFFFFFLFNESTMRLNGLCYIFSVIQNYRNVLVLDQSFWSLN